MKRRSNAMAGCVRFPVEDPAWPSSGEGGMVVKLVVCDDRHGSHEFAKCAGAHVVDVLSEVLIADDRRPLPTPQIGADLVPAEVYAELERERAAANAWQAYHYPHAHRGDAGLEEARFRSRDYLACLVMGSTGWSGFNEASGRYWSCTYDDLTPAGRALYHQIESLYPGCRLHLLTFLDT